MPLKKGVRGENIVSPALGSPAGPSFFARHSARNGLTAE